MQVLDLVNQYQNSLNSGSKIATKTKGIEQLSKTVASLEKGQVFEGTVSSVRGDKVTLALSSGQTITARLDKNVSVGEGQSVFFQVKSNEGGTIQIRPISSEFGGNPTLLAALKGAGLPENETNLKIINSLMKEQLPIDKDTIRGMLNYVKENPDTNIDTLVSLKKLDLPINDSMITQFENYKVSEGEILKTVEHLSEQITDAFTNPNTTKEDVLSFQKELLQVILPEGETGDTIATKIQIDTNTAVDHSMISEDSNLEVVNDGNPKISLQEGENNKSIRPEMDVEIPRDSLAKVLSPEGKVELDRLMNEFVGIKESAPLLFDDNGKLRMEVKGSDIIKLINNYFEQSTGTTKSDVIKAFLHDSVKSIVNNLMENSWTIEPKELLKKNSVNKLYEKIDEDMQKIIESSKQHTHSDNNPISQTAQSVKDNLNFIREVNQMYQYVQIPLKMSGENTTGELFVYANKKQKRSENDEITAFLHFDMEHLGATDISVKLLGTKLDTRFFLEDDISYNLIEQNLPILEERLNELGYSATLTCENDSNTVNFVEDFLKQDAKSAGDIRRYSFDVRA